MKSLRAKRAIETLEAAIIFPIATLVMLATINLGMVVYGQQAVQAAARPRARMGSVAQYGVYAVVTGISVDAGENMVLVQASANLERLFPSGEFYSLGLYYAHYSHSDHSF